MTLVKNSDFEKPNEEPPWREDGVDENFNFLAEALRHGSA
jgi:hypothetical protein